MSIKHTPGPWTTKELQVYAEDGNGSTLAHVYDPSRDHDHSEAEANALLIAAAPDLLEALRFLLSKVDDLSGYWKEDTDHAVRDAQEAIAKAEGRL